MKIGTALGVLSLKSQCILLLIFYYEAITSLVSDGWSVLGKFLSDFNKFNPSTSATAV